mmetsp:Transcript_91360/g.178928  ORF Transcript_91360/g.178928 Transcript_91360/m.178928 type:complete len:216 (-) Transcript_91360:21-668(-)
MVAAQLAGRSTPLGSPPLACEGLRHPVQALVEAVPRGCASGLDAPVPAPQLVQPEFFRDLPGLHRPGQVLLVRQDQQRHVAHFVLRKQLEELFPGIFYALAVAAVDDEDHALGPSIVVAPQLAELVLAANVPDRETDVTMLHDLHVETDRRDRRHHLPQAQTVQDRGLPRGVQAHHQDPHLLLARQALPDLRERQAHSAGQRRRAKGTRGWNECA